MQEKLHEEKWEMRSSSRFVSHILITKIKVNMNGCFPGQFSAMIDAGVQAS